MRQVLSALAWAVVLLAVAVAAKHIDHATPDTLPLISPDEFSWDHPLVQRMLWEGRNETTKSKHDKHDKHDAPRRIIKRTNIEGQQVGGKHCLGCAGGMVPAMPTIDELTIDYLENQMLKTESDLRDRCVFYTGVTNSEAAINSWTLEPGADRPGLSKTATAFTCSKGMYSIWQLWPGGTANVQPNPPPDNEHTPNFWEVFLKDSWLQKVAPKPICFKYFENMSSAMARRCKGKVYVMSLKPLDLPGYGQGTEANNNAHSIWNNYEWPTLKNNGGVTQLIGLTAKGPNGEVGDMWELNMSDLSKKGPYTGAVPRGLGKRDTCTNNRAYQPPGQDWFGTGRF
ncbi:uncharacterized protein B0I36DRAFT_346275 [Microdochium trichocladiopsis]|uniref:Uncharacterized protein n=1 Tax=Microdochium trichocladiopsis TaxID=1682393 RepID=A0A9P9BV47_9PEZI|nr:uncharacterized protein B0I36DRAFT_346275 [Microdochium trichocladiopsis]KAH7038276.1 hypothetical protein B0I36DRAFT_346275 [Microdochium trichocladiopsis]